MSAVSRIWSAGGPGGGRTGAQFTVDEVFAPELPGLDRAEIRRWYNGYNAEPARAENPSKMICFSAPARVDFDLVFH
jgi:hypothetical protein